MDIEFSSLATLVSSLVFIVIIVKLVKPRSKSTLPPGPRKLPLIGNLHNLLASSEPPHHTIAKLSAKYGPIMHLQLGEVSMLIMSSPDAAKEILKVHDANFAFRPALFATEVMSYGKTDILFSPYGEYWRQLRKLCTIEILSNKRVQSFRPIREEEFYNLCRWIASKAGSVFNLSAGIESSTCDIIMRVCFGGIKKKEQEEFMHVVHKHSALLEGFCLADVYPSITLFQKLSGMRGKLEKLHKISDRILNNIIDNHRVANKVADSSKAEDLVDVLLRFNNPGGELYLTTDNIKAILFEMFSGGTETSSSTVNWTMAELLKQPRVMNKAQEEVRRVFGEQGYVNESKLHELDYLKLIIKETLRMHPPAPLMFPRESREACEIQGYKIPAKTRVMINAWAIARDPAIWKDGESYIPERYLEKPVDFTGTNFEYLPFGSGRRICPGTSFGVANVDLPLAMLLYHFDWVLPGGMKPEELDMTEAIGIIATKKNPVNVIPILKNPLPAI